MAALSAQLTSGANRRSERSPPARRRGPAHSARRSPRIGRREGLGATADRHEMIMWLDQITRVTSGSFNLKVTAGTSGVRRPPSVPVFMQPVVEIGCLKGDSVDVSVSISHQHVRRSSRKAHAAAGRSGGRVGMGESPNLPPAGMAALSPWRTWMTCARESALYQEQTVTAVSLTCLPLTHHDTGH